MVYRAQVIDNSGFLTNGKIRVRILKYYYGDGPSHNLFMTDLSKNPEKILEGQRRVDGVLKHNDVDVRVFSPIGGGQDYGVFFLPQVNSDGIVLMIGDPFENSNDYLWLGSTFDMFNNTIKMPSDSMSNENGIQDKKNNMSILDGALVIKLKSTNLKNPEDPAASKNDLDWNQSPIENLIVINKNRVFIDHAIIENKKNVGNDKITLDSDGIYMSSESTKNDSNSSMTIKSGGGFALSTNMNKTQTTVMIEGTKDGIEMISTSGAKASSIIKQEHDSISINTKGTGVTVSDGVVNIKSSGDIYLDAKNVSLGKSGNRIVMASSNIDSFALSGGVILTTSDSLTG